MMVAGWAAPDMGCFPSNERGEVYCYPFHVRSQP